MGPVYADDPQVQPTVWSHADHWHRGPFGLDAWLHVGQLTWADRRPPAPKEYRQELTLLNGRLTTFVSGEAGQYTLSSWFDPENPDFIMMEIDQDFPGGFPPLLFEPILCQERGYSGKLQGKSEVIDDSPGCRVLRIQVGTSDSRVAVRLYDLKGQSTMDSDSQGIRIQLPARGRHFLILGCVGADRESSLRDFLAQFAPSRCAAAAAGSWRRRWGRGWIDVPDREAQTLWARSHFYILSSYGADVRPPAPPMGWSGAVWPYGFPQDLSYIHPALLRLGHLDIARSWVEIYARTIPSMREATKRIYGAEGVMWAWEYPIGETSCILAEGSPNSYQFEIHNAAYPARMAYETAGHITDLEWVRKFAWEVVRESARYFASLLRRAGDGLWDLRVTPSMGQDELDQEGGKNYLCSLFSAKYTLQSGIRLASRLGLESDETLFWKGILKDGLAFPRLLDRAVGMYATREGIDLSQLGSQKHPIQLNPLFCLPLEIDEPTRNAAKRSRELCVGVGKRGSQGWTLPALWLTSVHSGESAGFINDLHLGRFDGLIDPEWLQICESAPDRGPYFITSHGLYLQAMQDALVSDFSDELSFGSACPKEWENVSFGGLHTRGGKVWKGSRVLGKWIIEEDVEDRW